MKNWTDERVMQEIKKGKVEMLAILFEKYHVKIFNFFLRLCNSRQQSEDMVQEVFIRTLKYRNSYKEESKFSTWLYKIARNVNIDFFKKQKNEITINENIDQEEEKSQIPEEKLQKQQDQVLISKALAKLSMNKREVLILSRYQNLKYQEIAKLLNCSIGNVKILAYRAIKDLKKYYLDFIEV
jgi:RNA polymerase sigma-70 factor (ECF subfamily)